MQDDLNCDRSAERVAQSMIGLFGPHASGKAIELIRLNTSVGNRDAAAKWHRVMSLIEEYRRNPLRGKTAAPQ